MKTQLNANKDNPEDRRICCCCLKSKYNRNLGSVKTEDGVKIICRECYQAIKLWGTKHDNRN